MSTSSNGPTHTLQSNIKLLRKGYLNYFDPRLIALLNFCSVTFCEGVNLNLIVEEFMGDMGDKGDKGKENSVYST